MSPMKGEVTVSLRNIPDTDKTRSITPSSTYDFQLIIEPRLRRRNGKCNQEIDSDRVVVRGGFQVFSRVPWRFLVNTTLEQLYELLVDLSRL